MDFWFLLPGNGLWLRPLLPSGGFENKSIQQRIHSKLLAHWWSHTSASKTGLSPREERRSTRAPPPPPLQIGLEPSLDTFTPSQPLTSASNTIPSSNPALQLLLVCCLPSSLPPSPPHVIATYRQLSGCHVDMVELPQMRKKDLERTPLPVLRQSFLGLTP